MRKRRGVDWLVLFGLCAVGVGLGQLQTRSRTQGVVDPFGRIVQTAVRPLAGAVTGSVNGVQDFFSGMFNASSLIEENRRLNAIVAGNALYVETVTRLNQEIDSLRRIQGFPSLPGQKRLPAEIVGYFPNESRVTINVGAEQSVKVGQPVVAADGLMGRVQVVDRASSQVLLVSSPQLKLGAMAQRNPPSAGLLRGENATTLILEFADARVPVDIGDLVVTSGFSERIPRGIVIGRVIQVDDNIEFGVRQARVYPSVRLGTVREVLVLQ